MTDIRERNRAKKDYLRQYLFLVREQEGLEQMLAELIEEASQTVLSLVAKAE